MKQSAFSAFMLSWKQRITEVVLHPLPAVNGRPLLPSESESDMEYERRTRG